MSTLDVPTTTRITADAVVNHTFWYDANGVMQTEPIIRRVDTYPTPQLTLLAAQYIYGLLTDDYNQEKEAEWMYQQHNFEYTEEFNQLIDELMAPLLAVLRPRIDAFDREIAAGRIESNNL